MISLAAVAGNTMPRTTAHNISLENAAINLKMEAADNSSKEKNNSANPSIATMAAAENSNPHSRIIRYHQYRYRRWLLGKKGFSTLMAISNNLVLTIPKYCTTQVPDSDEPQERNRKLSLALGDNPD